MIKQQTCACTRFGDTPLCRAHSAAGKYTTPHRFTVYKRALLLLSGWGAHTRDARRCGQPSPLCFRGPQRTHSTSDGPHSKHDGDPRHTKHAATPHLFTKQHPRLGFAPFHAGPVHNTQKTPTHTGGVCARFPRVRAPTRVPPHTFACAPDRTHTALPTTPKIATRAVCAYMCIDELHRIATSKNGACSLEGAK